MRYLKSGADFFRVGQVRDGFVQTDSWIGVRGSEAGLTGCHLGAWLQLARPALGAVTIGQQPCGGVLQGSAVERVWCAQTGLRHPSAVGERD
eukprot:scaffold1070_cov245-Pinguiococcus_pyrenoidosus.AAC.51